MTTVQPPIRTLEQIDKDLSRLAAQRLQAQEDLHGPVVRYTPDRRSTLMTQIETCSERIEDLLEERSQVAFVNAIVSL